MSYRYTTWVDDAKGTGIVLVLVLYSVFFELLRVIASIFAMMLFVLLSLDLRFLSRDAVHSGGLW